MLVGAVIAVKVAWMWVMGKAANRSNALGLDPAILMSALALLVSVGALFVAIFEASVQRAQQRAEVWPYVEFGTSFTGEGFAIQLVNKGAGPARVRGMDLLVDGKPVGDALSLVAAVAGPDTTIGYDVISTARISNAVLAPGEKAVAFGLRWTEETERAFSTVGQIEATLCYCSIFDECFAIELNGAAQPAECRAPVAPYQ